MVYRVAIIVDPIDEQYAGIYTYARELVEHLEKIAQNNIEFTYIHIRKNTFFDGKKEVIIPLYRRIPFMTFLRKYLYLPFFFAKEGFDLVHDLSHIAPFPWKKTAYKKIFTIFDLTPVLYPQYHTWFVGFAHKILFPFLLKRVDGVVTISEHTKQDILATYPYAPNIEVIPLAVKNMPEGQKKLEGDPYILFTSTIEPRKNIETLLRAFEIVKKSIPYLKLVLVGKKGWKCDNIFEMIDASPYRDDILVKGFVSNEELAQLYVSAHVFVYPSHYEGFGLPILEAMRYGVPVLAANNSSIPEVLGDAGMLFSTTNSEELATLIEKVCSDDELRKTLSLAGKKRYSEFSWEQVALSTYHFYCSLLHDQKK